ncbi:MAG: TonB family protein [Steroidobacteraceae bacterium]|nr:TonB family protein [Pseudomonadota bacterium]MBP6105341.1 TonB family protein [Steroidobacteraceae bacterium]MBP7012890.1 TonB family protein [Steroidobacteraceae bacterium]
MTATSAPDQAQPTPAFAGKPSVSHPPRVEIIALTDDDALLEQIGQALDGDATFRHAESVDAAGEFIRPLRPCLLLLDARSQQDLPAAVASVQSPDGTCVVVVLAPPEQSTEVARSLKGSATFAILSIPFERGPTIAVLDGAREEALARLALAAQPILEPVAVESAPGVEPAVVKFTPSVVAPVPVRATVPHGNDVPRSRTAALRSAAPAGGGRWRTWGAVLAGAALVAIAAAWVMLRAPSTDDRAVASATPEPRVAEPVAAPSAKAAADVLSGTSEDLLDRAHGALNERHYTAPEGENALALFRAVLAQDPDNDEAQEGLQRIGGLLDERLQTELAQRRLNDAAGTLAQLKLIRPGDPALARFDAKLEEAQAAAAAEVSRRQAAARAEQLAQLVSTRPRDGKPVDAAAVRAAPPAAIAQPLVTQPEQLAQPLAERSNAARPLEPPKDNAVASLNAPHPLPAGELKRTRYVPPEYPKDALKRGVGGEVRVRFTLDAGGRVKSAEVVDSSPADVFDRAALDAVRRWRFKPPAAGNPDSEATVVTNIVFRPDDARTP